MAKVRYAYFFEKNPEEFEITQDYLDCIRLLKEPRLYNNVKYLYQLVFDGTLGDTNFPNTVDYELFWELIFKLRTDPSFVANGTYVNYGASDVNIDDDLVEFKKDGDTWKLYGAFARLKVEYPVEYTYLVFFDETSNIDELEIFPTLSFFVDKLGKDNQYTDIYRYDYQDEVTFQPFYVIYYGKMPTVDKAKYVIREEVVKRFGYDEAKRKYPNLFIDAYRRIYPMYENKGYPINFEMAKSFVLAHDIFMPDIILILDWTCPIVVEYGIVDVLPNYSPIIDGDIESNRFIYFLSKVLNYLEGKVLTPQFIIEAQFTENEFYAAFVYKGIEWRVVKMK